MNSQNVALVSMVLGDKVGEEQQFFILQQCQNLDDNLAPSLTSMVNGQFKSPITGLLLQAFLGIFSVGRFYKGDILVGVMCWIFLVFLVLLGSNISYNEDAEVMLGLFFGFYLIFVYVDCYFIYKGIQKDNFNKFQNFLLYSKNNKL